MTNLTPTLLVALSESRSLGADIARAAGLALLPIEERQFEGGEFKLRPLASLRNRSIVVVQSLAGTAEAPVADRLVRLLFLLFGLRDAGAATTSALVPYLTFARKDRRTQPRDPVNTRYVAQMLEATGLARIMALDVHNPAAFDNSFRIPADHFTALPMFARQLCAAATRDMAVASPDIGGIKRAQLFGESLTQQTGRPVDVVFVEKRRARGVVSGGRVAGDVTGKSVVIIADLCATGGTLTHAAQALRAAGATAITVAFTHAPLAAGLNTVLSCGDIDQVLTTDSVGDIAAGVPPGVAHKLALLPVAPLFAEALRRVERGEPVTPLFM
jgi:ribose-phosphate pyrophosphokinase